MIQRTLIFGLIFIFLAACGGDESSTPPTEAAVAELPANSDTPEPPAEIPTETAVPPTPTPAEPLAATVNGQPITFSEYERELARYEQAQAQLGQSLEGTD